MEASDMPTYDNPLGTTAILPDGRSVAQGQADEQQRLRQMRATMQRFGQTSRPGTGAWSVGDYGDALPPMTTK
jgi:hypothetical protein